MKSLQGEVAAVKRAQLGAAKSSSSNSQADEPAEKPAHILKKEELEVQLSVLNPDLKKACLYLRSALHEDRKNDLYLAARNSLQNNVQRGGRGGRNPRAFGPR